MRFIISNPAAARARYASDVVIAGGAAYISDVLPVDLDDDRVPLPESIEAQTAKVLANLDRLAGQAGLSRDHVVSVRVALVDMPRIFARMNRAYEAFFPADRLPARSCIGVSSLTRGAQVAMDFILTAQATGR